MTKEITMKVFSGGISTETNTFSPMPTGMADFDIVRAESIPAEGISPAIDHFQKRT
ncbi:MAG: M81 family metallopeptidase, partial [Caldilineaceae bacterium]|nr:M81 family metallopeptidase [Caldilineaceae bacterium]